MPDNVQIMASNFVETIGNLAHTLDSLTDEDLETNIPFAIQQILDDLDDSVFEAFVQAANILTKVAGPAIKKDEP